MFTALLFTADFMRLVDMSKDKDEKKKISVLVGEQVKKARKESGLSQEALSEEAGFYRTYVGHIEVGKYTPSIYTLYKIAKRLKIKVASLIPF